MGQTINLSDTSKMQWIPPPRYSRKTNQPAISRRQYLRLPGKNYLSVFQFRLGSIH